MAASKHAKYIITELDKRHTDPEAVARYAKIGRRILWLDEQVLPGSFQMNCSWYLHASDTGPAAHNHDVPEIIGFFSSDPDNPYDLGAEIEFWLEDEKFMLTRTCMIFVPPNMKHCPLILRRVDKPIFHFTTVTAGKYEILHSENLKKQAAKHSKYIITELKEPEEKKRIAKDYTKYARRILWMDENVVPGAFHMNTAWFLKAAHTLENVPHTHDNPEIIGFFGSDPNNPHDLGAEVEIWLEGKKQIITKSAMLFIPPETVHCPLILNRVDRPIFHFTVVDNGLYVKDEKS
jgi:hypothetical protein